VKREAAFGRLVELMAAAPVRVTAVEAGEGLDRHVEDALTGADAVAAAPPGPLVDVGSGGGVPGLVLALRFPDRPVTLVESNGRKAAFLVEAAEALGLETVTVVGDRSEAFARGPGRDAFSVATCRALAPPPVALELCLPLVRPGGRLVLYAGAVDSAVLARVAAELGAELDAEVPVPGAERRRLVVAVKRTPTPDRFPRRAGMAAKRPLS
jgi:16S rRNA (guanine527-N7)-methyltransferase